MSRGTRGRSACRFCKSTSSPGKVGLVLGYHMGSLCQILSKSVKVCVMFYLGGHNQWGLGGGQQVGHKAIQLQVRYKSWSCHSPLENQ